jgi:hypothetical protein
MARREQLSIGQLISPTGATISFGTAAPAAGKLGDFVINTAPTAGGVFGWSCTTAGSTATWKAVAIAA